MSTPKIKVYRLDKGYNKDADNDIQTKINSELLPFIQKKSKPTDAYYLTGISEQKIQWKGEKINLTPVVAECPVTGTYSKKIECENWIKTGFYRPRLGYSIGENFYELASFNNSEEKLLNEMSDVRSGVASNEPYFENEERFIYAHPFVFCGIGDNQKSICYETKYTEENTELGKKIHIHFKIDENKVAEILGKSEVTPANFVVQYYVVDEKSTSTYLLNYPVYNHSNYFFKPQIFTPKKYDLTILYRTSQEIECDDTWIFYGNGSPLVTCGNIVLEKNDYELIYSYVNNSRKMIVKISEEFLSLHPAKDHRYELHYNTDYTLLKEVEGEEGDYNIDLDTGEIKFVNDNHENFFVYYYQLAQTATTFISEHTNWSFGHLRENPDIFFGEEDYTGDEDEDKDTGTPLYSGLKPSFVKDGYQIDYLRGCVEFTDGKKSIYKSESDIKDKNLPETFVRANYSYYPEIHGVFRQKMDLISEVDGYTYKTENDFRYIGSIDKRWIMKSDNYQPMFFENFTDKINVCSRYRTTSPNYDILEKKKVLEVLGTNTEYENNGKLTFILPLIESKFIVFSGFEENISNTITFKNEEDEELETFSFTGESGVFYVNEKLLGKGNAIEIGEVVKIKFVYLHSDKDTNSHSFQLISAKI